MDKPAHKRMHETWGRQIRAARKAHIDPATGREMTQIDLAKLVEIEQNTVSRIERGEAAPSDALKIRLCLALDKSLDDLFGWPMGVLDRARYEAEVAGAKAS